MPALEVVAKGQVTVGSFRTGIVRNPPGRDSHLSGHLPSCEVVPVQSMYRMTVESVVVYVGPGLHRPLAFRQPEVLPGN